MWYIYTCGHTKCAPNYRSNIEKKVRNPCDECRKRMHYRRPVLVVKTERERFVSFLQKHSKPTW